MAKEASKAVTRAQANLPAEFAAQIAADAGMGSEDASSEDMVVPFIKIGQALSPEVNKRDGAYIDGLEQGDFFNTATQQVWKGDEGMHFVPVKFQRKYLEWTPRDKGGGFNGEREPSIIEKCRQGEKGENILPNGNEIVVTGTWYGLTVDPKTGACEAAVISLSKTQLKKSRQLMTKLKTIALPHPSGKGKFNPPLFYNMLKVTSVPESNDQGNWFGWVFEIAGNVFDSEYGSEFYDNAKALLEAVDSGVAKTAAPDAPQDGGDGGEGRKQSAAERNGDADIPF